MSAGPPRLSPDDGTQAETTTQNPISTTSIGTRFRADDTETMEGRQWLLAGHNKHINILTRKSGIANQ